MLLDFITPGWHEKDFANVLFSTASVWGFLLGVFLFTALNLLQPTPESADDVAVSYYFLTYCNAHVTEHFIQMMDRGMLAH